MRDSALDQAITVELATLATFLRLDEGAARRLRQARK
jgi:hypothetical protein